MTAIRSLVTRLTLPYDSMRTLYEGDSEVRLYRNTWTGAYQVGKRIDALGLDAAVAVQEAQLLLGIDHPNLAEIMDVVEVEDPACPPPMKLIEMIMPHYSRGSICDFLVAGGKSSVLEACQHAQAMLRGLAELHDGLGVLHRDLKSPNVFLSDDDSLVKVGDLGIAVRMDELGTAEAYANAQLYTPPETLPTKRCDRRSDLYGAGLLLFEMVNGPLVYDSYTIVEIEARLRRNRPGPRKADLAFGPHVPPNLRTVIRKAVNSRPGDRYQTSHAMSAALSRVSLIDWRIVNRDDSTAVWEGTRAGSHRMWRVEATRLRHGNWRLSGLQQKNSRRRAVPDAVMPQLDGAEATTFFDQLVTISAAV